MKLGPFGASQQSSAAASAPQAERRSRGTVAAMLAVACVGLTFAMLAPSARAATPEQIDDAIKRGVAHLWTLQLPSGEFKFDEPAVVHDYHRGGYTAIAVYALLAAGESPKDPRILRAIDALKKQPAIGIYTLGFRMSVWNLMPKTDEIRGLIKADVKGLIDSGLTNKIVPGKYGYTLNYPYEGDNSNSQYGVLGVWAAANAGMEIQLAYWDLVGKAWRASQNPDGGWSYKVNPDLAKDPTRGTMVAAGIATLFIVSDQLYGDLGADCKGSGRNENTIAIDKAMKWMAGNFDKVYGCYGWYGVERIGLASGLKYIGDIDWYQTLAAKVLAQQKPDGSFGGEQGEVPDCAYSILFLVRGRAPLMLNKLEYGTVAAGAATVAAATTAPAAPSARAVKPIAKDAAKDASPESHWNTRARDAANVSKWMGKQMERELAFQIVSLKHPSKDLHDAPILYIAGNQAMNFTDEEVAKLRRYVEEGGLILGNPDCASAPFATSFKSLGAKLFPAYEFRELPKSHVIYTGQTFLRAKWKTSGNILQGMTNGARELMLLISTADHAKFWQAQNYKGHEETHELVADIFLYSVDTRFLRYRGQTYLIDPPVQAPPSAIKVARLEYVGNWDPEPGGWRRLSAALARSANAELNVVTVKLGEGKLSPTEYRIAHLTGTSAVDLTPPQRDELKKYIEAGGTLVIDGAGGSAEFADSIDKLWPTIAPAGAAAPKVLPGTHPLYAASGSLPALTDVTYRDFAKKRIGAAKGPLLRGVEIGGRIRVIYSPEDLSVGLVGQAIDGISGYSPDSATAVMEHVLLYAASGEAPAPATNPTAN